MKAVFSLLFAILSSKYSRWEDRNWNKEGVIERQRVGHRCYEEGNAKNVGDYLGRGREILREMEGGGEKPLMVIEKWKHYFIFT